MAATIIDDSLLNSFIKQINICQKENGGGFDIPETDVPGLGNILMTFIRVVEKGFTTMFLPILELKDLILKYLIKPPKFISEITSYASKIANFLSSPIEFLLNELIEPISENVNIPLQLDLSSLFPGISVNVEKGFLKLPKETQDRIKTMLSVSSEYFQKLLEFILFPLKVLTGLIEALAKLISDALSSPITKIPELVINFTTNFVNSVIDIITNLLGNVLKPILNSIVPSGFENIEKLISDVKELIIKSLKGTLTVEFVEKKKKENSDFNKVFGFVNIIICFMKTFLAFIVMFPTAFFGAGAGDSVQSAKNAANAVDIIKNDYKDPVTTKVNEINSIKLILSNSELSQYQRTQYNNELAIKEQELLELKEELIKYLQDNLNKNEIQKVINEDNTVFRLLELNADSIINYKFNA